MTRRVLLCAMLGLGLGWIAVGCEEGPGEGAEKPAAVAGDAANLVKSLAIPDTIRRQAVAQSLADMPADKLKSVKADLKKALGKEKEQAIKDLLQKALDKAQ